MKSAFKEPRLSVLFVGYLVVYGVSTFVLGVALLTGLILLGNTGTVQPANMQEIILSQNMSTRTVVVTLGIVTAYGNTPLTMKAITNTCPWKMAMSVLSAISFGCVIPRIR